MNTGFGKLKKCKDLMTVANNNEFKKTGSLVGIKSAFVILMKSHGKKSINDYGLINFAFIRLILSK